MVVVGGWLDSMTMEVFSHLGDSRILQVGPQWWCHLSARKGRDALLRMCGSIRLFEGRASENSQLELLCFQCLQQACQAMGMPSDPGTLTQFVLTSSSAQPPRAVVLLGWDRAEGCSLLVWQRNQAIRDCNNMHVSHSLGRGGVTHILWKANLWKKKLSKLVYRAKHCSLHRVMTYLPLLQCQPSVPSLLPGTLLISLASAEALGTPSRPTAAKKIKHSSLANSLRS